MRKNEWRFSRVSGSFGWVVVFGIKLWVEYNRYQKVSALTHVYSAAEIADMQFGFLYSAVLHIAVILHFCWDILTEAMLWSKKTKYLGDGILALGVLCVSVVMWSCMTRSFRTTELLRLWSTMQIFLAGFCVYCFWKYRKELSLDRNSNIEKSKEEMRDE